jgi:CheY-like chemotaxis protein
MAAPVTLFYSYSRKDEDLRKELDDHLKILQRRGMLQSWHDRKIDPAETWEKEIDEHLRNAELVLLLVSKDFVASDYIWSKELNIAMRRHETGQARVVPILIRAVDIQPDDAPFMKLQGLPSDLRPVTSWSIRDEAWTNVAKGIRALVTDIQSSRRAEASFARAMPMRQAQEDDPLLQRVVDAVAGQIENATIAKGGGPSDAALIRSQARTLIDTRSQKRVLWVDDRPEGNRFEIATLSKLQIEVLIAQSTDEAMARIADDTEGFDLVISDWERAGEAPQAGLKLLQLLRHANKTMPVVFYHGSFDPAQRARRAERAKNAGAFGEAIVPAELLGVVVKALSD